MQNNFSFFATKQKHKTLFFLSLTFILPVNASETHQPEIQAPPLALKIAKKSKVKKITDLRILVDISGSMKKTDPNNLRRSAVRLLAGLIPQGSRAGIWNFGKQVNMAVKIGVVNDAWRSLAREQSKKINSVGLYTNIESAMRKVSFDWNKPDPRYKRNLILLTDGHVDVSEDSLLDEESKRRILKDILPQLEKAQVRIHTIALSNDVDGSLLSTLSAYTDGLYKKVVNADELQKLFLEMLEQSVTLDTLPIKDNTFKVDASINDMTLLIFNKDKAHPTEIITPEKVVLKKDTHSDQLKWFSDEGYDLITIKKPLQGVWKIKAPSDKNNRVVVATNLKLKTNDLPSSLKLGDVLNITAHLEEDGKPLADKRLLSKFNFVLKRKAERSSERRYPLIKSESDEFNYTIQLAPVFKIGNNELIIQAKSPTVEREIRHQFQVYTDDKIVKHNESVSHGKKNKASEHDSISADDKDVANPKGENKTHKDNAEDSHSKDENKIHKNNIEDSHSKENKNTGGHDKEKDEDQKDLDATVDGEHKDDGSNEHTEEAHVDWTTIIIAIVAGNIFLTGLVVGVIKLVKRRKAKLTQSVEDDEKQDAKDRAVKKEKSAAEKKDD